ncbi:carbohydrate-binding protein [Streptomyces sp. SID3343]|uniref:carbohydrate-binding protein n=1 Tax=Streptomyces sp. SID3343 TaxID=2690260 RepID=UPI00136FD3A5|nr:carbohydrate-binding protein [Streptomyces sp. SID3343]MYW04165.1 carbohydrate-binding protein [Streptomyces sp. SID3343]
MVRRARPRSRPFPIGLVTALVTALVFVASGSAGPASATSSGPSGTIPSPTAPHRGVVTQDASAAPTPGRDAAVRAFVEQRAKLRAALSGEVATTPDDAATAGASLAPTHNFWGVFPQPGTHDGITATHSVDPSYRVADSQNFTYAPTTKAQNSCMEVVTAYWSQGAEIWAWDWCGTSGPAKTLTVNADFLAKYTTTTNGITSYSVQLAKDPSAGNAWSSYLYNHRTQAWELLFRSSGTDQSQLAYGWDIFEIYATVNSATGKGYFCTEARNRAFDSADIKLRRNGAWQLATPTDSPWTSTNPRGRDFLCPSLTFTRAAQNHHWTVRP